MVKLKSQRKIEKKRKGKLIESVRRFCFIRENREKRGDC